MATALKSMSRVARKPVQAAPAPALKIAHEIPAQLLAVALAYKGPKVEAPLEPGEYAVRGTVVLSVDCAVKKGEPVQAHQAATLDMGMVIVGIAERLNVKPSALAGILEAALLAASEEAVDQLYLDAVQGVLARVASQLSEALPRVTRQGATRVTGEVAITSFEPL